jgi:hypothetical protein
MKDESLDPMAGSINNDALIGDKILGLCLVIYLREQGCIERGQVQDAVSFMLSNQTLCDNAARLGVVADVDAPTKFTASRVEQRAYQIFLEQGRDIDRTTQKLSPLFEP